MMPRVGKRKFRMMFMIPCFTLASSVVLILQANFKGIPEHYNGYHTGRSLLEFSNDSLFRCIPSGISSFPSDFFTQEERQRGGVIIHLLLTAYICAMIAVVCDDYFIPSLEIISDKLQLPSDIAGATFMAIGTSAPELFSSITGSFVTEGDIGIGTIIGSAVFNILAVTGLVGLILWNEDLQIDWYPIARDCGFYGLTIACLIWIISDNIVTWWESLILLMMFLLYLIVIYFNTTLERWAKHLVKRAQESDCFECCSGGSEKAPLLPNQIFVPELLDSQNKPKPERDSFSIDFREIRENAASQKNAIYARIDSMVVSEELYSEGTLCSAPTGGAWSFVWWVMMYPSLVLFYLTIPDIRNSKWNKLFPLTFLMSVVWIGVLSYLAVWMVTVIGYTFGIPDSVSGLTVLAAGTSVPELISSVLVAQSGLGNMAISNLVGSNTFDISFCLGAPWLAKTLISEEGYLLVYSSALTYTTATLLLTLIAFVLTFVFTGWKLNKAVGFTFMTIYSLVVVLACMYELNMFGEINVPGCDS
ncbi:sodium/potassium/calcium exchanger 5-like isoform X2 [Uloborus diversus]|uniref:sodium/potassium/calcium exchanger 5-like isoform X2 n=1 Tax=Uloborus diversus TaxID=327109 RepID=UPI002409D3DB|nr:sodium/potassium/calcium exchanger 5-like isoform X2 [Uloborus diversus]